MEIEISQSVKIRLSGLERLDPIEVLVDDYEPGKGKITITCYGKAWTASWFAMSDQTISQFFRRCGNDYLIGYLSPQLAGLKSGEVALYTDEGAKIVLKRGRIIDVACDTYRVTCKNYEVNAEEKADFNTPMVTASEQVTAQNKITGNGGMAIKGGAGATFEGNIGQSSGNYVTNGDVQAGKISLTGHHHIDSVSGNTSDAKA